MPVPTPPHPTPPRRLLLLTGLAVVIGLLSRGAAGVLVRMIAAITNLGLYRRLAWDVPSFMTLEVGPGEPGWRLQRGRSEGAGQRR